MLDAAVDWVWTIDGEVMPVERVPARDRYDLREPPHLRRTSTTASRAGPARRDILARRRLLPAFTCPDATRFQVYAPREGGFFVAEPVTNANAALNRPAADWPAAGLAVLRPGDEAAMVTRFTVEEVG